MPETNQTANNTQKTTPNQRCTRMAYLRICRLQSFTAGLLGMEPQRRKNVDRLAWINLARNLSRHEVPLPVKQIFGVQTPFIVAPAKPHGSIEYCPAAQADRVGIVVENGTQIS